MNPLLRADTDAPLAATTGDGADGVPPTTLINGAVLSDEQRAAVLWRRLLGYRHMNPNSRLGLLPISQLFDSFLVVLAEPARFRSLTNSAAADANGEAASLLSAPILPGGLKSLSLTATGGFTQDTVGEVLSRDIADLLLLIPPTVGTTFETAYLEHTVVSPAEILARKRAIVAVSQYMADCLCVFNIRAKLKVFLFGSVGLATVLPGGDNDVTLVLESSVPQSRLRRSDPWVPESPPSGSFDSFLQARTPDSANPTLDFLEIAKDFILNRVAEQNTVSAQREMEGGPRQAVSVRGEVINAAVPLLKLEYQDGSISGHQHIDISLDQMGGRTSMIFVHRVDERIGQDHLFRRSLLLVKHYCSTVLRVLGAQAGGLGSYTVTVMLMAVFNGLPEKVLKEGILEQSADGTSSRRVPLTPLQILVIFLDYYAHFDFDAFVVTIFGPLPVTAVQLTNYENTEAARGAHQQWVAITEIETASGVVSSGNSSPHPPSNLSGASPAPGKTSDFHSPNSNFNPQGEMHKANGFNIFGRSFREGTPASPHHLSSPSAAPISGPVSGRSSEAGGAISVMESASMGGSKQLDSPLLGDCCPASVLSALESAPGVANPTGSNHFSQQCIDEDFVDEYVQALSVEDVDLAFAQKIFFFPRFKAGKHHHHGSNGDNQHQQQPNAVTPTTASSIAPKAIAASLFKVRMMNIRDPLRPFSNLTPGVQRSSLVRIQAGFAKGVMALRATIHSVCFTDVDGTKYNPERVLGFVAKELSLIKDKPTDHTPVFHGIPLNVGVVATEYGSKIAPHKLPDEPVEGEAPAPSPSDEKASNHRHIEDMVVVLASHRYTLLPPAVTDAQQFWGSIIPYVKQPVSSATIEAVSPVVDDVSGGDPKKIFNIFNMSNDDIRKPISEFQAASAQDSQHMASLYKHLHQHSHPHAHSHQHQHHSTNNGHHQQQQQQHHQQSGHHHISSHSQQQQHQGASSTNNNGVGVNSTTNGSLARRQSNQASYSHGSPAPESLHATSGPNAGNGTLMGMMDPRDISRPNSQHSSSVNFRGSPSYGKSSSKQPGNSEAPPLPPRPLSGTGPSTATPQQQTTTTTTTPPQPRSHNPYMPNQPILIPPTANVPQQAMPPPMNTSTEAASSSASPTVAGGATTASPSAPGRGRGGRGGTRGRGIQ